MGVINMQIDPIKKVDAVSQSVTNSPQSMVKRADKDQIAFERYDGISKAIADTPTVRPEMVKKAKDLIGTVPYPPRETIEKISFLLAMHLQAQVDNLG